jgi:hypothetical protein
MPRMREATRSGWKGSSASVFSPMPRNLMGLPVMWRTDRAAPPRASPSALVSTTPVSGRASLKALAVLAASWPVMLSTTNRVSTGETRCAGAGSRPSCPHRRAGGRRCRRSARPETACGPAPGHAWRWPRVLACGAGGKKLDPHLAGQGLQLPDGRRAVDVAADHRHRLLVALLEQARQLGHVVVLPEPCRPAMSTTAGGCTLSCSASLACPMTAISSSLTILTSAWPGVRLRAPPGPGRAPSRGR